jgi:bacterioferritin-associated ferredoxin
MILKVGSQDGMVVCICAGISERKLRAVIADGAGTLREIERRCGAGAGCGSCRAAVRQCLRDSRETAAPVTMEFAAAEAPELAPA